MKDLKSHLYESILDIPDNDDMLDDMSDQAAIMDWIDKHIKKDNLEAKFIINKDGTISDTRSKPIISINFDGFDELPEFIKFKDDPKMYLDITISEPIKSFRGIPKVCETLNMHCGRTIKSIPELDIEVHSMTGIYSAHGYCSSKFSKNLHIDFPKGGKLNMEIPNDSLDGIKITGKHIIMNFVNDFNFGDKISKIMSRKAPMNPYHGRYTDPITKDGYEAIEKFFKGFVNLDDVDRIEYTQASCLMKHNGVWYRCKNW